MLLPEDAAGRISGLLEQVEVKESSGSANYMMANSAGALVAVPVEWDELDEDLRFDRLTLRNVPERLKRLQHDPWEGFSHTRRAVTAVMMKKVGLTASRDSG